MQQQHSSAFSKIAFFSALCMFLSVIEYAFPKPMPFMRIGFANMSIMTAIFVLNIWQLFVLVLIKVLIQGLISGTIFSYVFVFSFFGSVFSLIFMLAVQRLFKKHISFVGISLAGCLGNNLAQIALSYMMIFKESTSFIAPVLLISGLITSFILGLFTQIFVDNSTWFSRIIEGTEFTSIESQNEKAVLERKKFSAKSFFKQLLRDIILIVSIVFFSLLIPSGKVLAQIGSFKITQTALIWGLKRALILVLSVKLSRLIIPSKIVLKGSVGNFINLILIYFRKLSEFEVKEKLGCKKNAGQKFARHLDNYLTRICFG